MSRIIWLGPLQAVGHCSKADLRLAYSFSSERAPFLGFCLYLVDVQHTLRARTAIVFSAPGAAACPQLPAP